jgi:hypothetical protein
MFLIRTVLLLCLLGPQCGSNARPIIPGSESVHQAIALGLSFFQEQRDQIPPDAFLLYQFLKERYSLPEIGTNEEFLNKLRLDTTEYDPILPFISMLRPMAYDTAFLALAEGTDPITIAGLWYDHIPEKEQLSASIRAMDWEDGYMITHAILARAVAKQQFKAPYEDELDGMLVHCALSLIDAKRPIWGDLEIEALAFVQFADPLFETPLTYLEEITALQNEDGSWSNQGDTRGTGDHHTSVLALWALLHNAPAEYTNNGRPFVLR